MNPEDWQRVKRILQPALELPAGARQEFLDRVCAGDPELRREVEAYCRFENEAAAPFGITGWGETSVELAGDPERAGPYRILRKIGEGGMGVVYLAERDDGHYHQQVAVKVVKSRPWDAGLTRRFRSERQILSDLNHPNIARLLDAGTTATGQLFYAMEYVDGVPVTEYCRLHRLPLRKRIDLFLSICLAVVHAHLKLIVHSDLKPDNILVSTDGTPKVVDFGLAKVFQPDAEVSESEASTTLILTPAYASPEQIAGRRPTMATDVYALGVLLFELLTGSGPFPLGGKPHFEVCRLILEEDPPPPSAVLRRRIRTASDIPIAPRQLEGDLDAIVLKSLRKEPERRYGTVDELRDDLERYLAGLPVRAARGSSLYRCRKFVKRRRWVLAFSALATIAVAAATVSVWWEARQAEIRFNNVRALAHSVIFELHDAVQDLPGSTAARKLLVEQALEYLRKLAASHGGRRDLQLELAAAYQRIGEVQSNDTLSSLGDTSAALISLGKSRELLLGVLRAAPADSDAQLMLRDVDRNLAYVQEQRGDEAGRAASSREAVDVARTLANRHPESRRFRASVHRLEALDSAAMGNWDAALSSWKSAAVGYQESLEEKPHDQNLTGRLADSYDGVATACKQLNQWDCAISYYRQAAAIRSRQLAAAPKSPRLAMLLSYHLIDLAWSEHATGAQAQAIADEQSALGLQRRIAAEDPQNSMAVLEIAKTLVTQGFIYRDNHDDGRALASMAEANGILGSLLRRDPYNQSTLFHLAWVTDQLGEIYRRRAMIRTRDRAAARVAWGEAAACFERSNQYLERLKLGGKLMGFLDDRNLRKEVPERLAECRRQY